MDKEIRGKAAGIFSTPVSYEWWTSMNDWGRCQWHIFLKGYLDCTFWHVSDGSCI